MVGTLPTYPGGIYPPPSLSEGGFEEGFSLFREVWEGFQPVSGCEREGFSLFWRINSCFEQKREKKRPNPA